MSNRAKLDLLLILARIISLTLGNPIWASIMLLGISIIEWITDNGKGSYVKD